MELKSYAFRREREESWFALQQLLERCVRDGADSISTEDLAKMPHLYRSAVSSLSVARAISLDRNVVLYLESLVRSAYLEIYGSGLRRFNDAWMLLKRELPRATLAGRYALALSVVTFALGALLGGYLVLDAPGRYYALADEALASRLGPDSGVDSLVAFLWQRPRTQEVLEHLARFPFSDASMGIFVMVGGGIVLGLPTFAVLVYAGLEAGVLGALYLHNGLSIEFVMWATSMGALRWCGPWLCGAAGFMLAEPMVFPPREGRARALRSRGWSAAVMAVGGIVLSVFARIAEWAVQAALPGSPWQGAIAFAIVAALAVHLAQGEQ